MTSRTWGLAILGVGFVAAVAWAINRGTLPRADFAFCNGTEVKSLDPTIAAGNPENRMANALFEGLVRWNPATLEPEPGVAQRWEINDDRTEYLFHLREGVVWSDGSPLTARDFRYSLRRLLDPLTAAEYAYQGWYVKNAKRYSQGARGIAPGDAVEIELNRPLNANPNARGRVVRGRLEAIEDGAGKKLASADVAAAWTGEAKAQAKLTFVVRLHGEGDERGDDLVRYRRRDDAAADAPPPAGVRWCRQILLDFREVGCEVVDARTIRYRLESPTHFFLRLLGFYSLFPVQQRCLETYRAADFNRDPSLLVGNGPFRPLLRRIRDRTRLVKNERYWDRDHVRLRTVDVLATESVNTQLNLFLTGEADWIYDVPASPLRELLREKPPRDDLNCQPVLISYFYLLNVTRPTLSDVRVRRALSLALDRRELVEGLLGGGQRAAYSLVPPGLPGYEAPETAREDAAAAQRLLAEAGFAEGRGFPPLSILYNTHEDHRAVAELIRKQWQRRLGISVRSRNEEFSTYLASQRLLKFDVSRRAWVADYADPNTFLSLFVSDSEHNNTGWKNAEYDRLIAAAGVELDAEQRMRLFAQAERILMDELPLLPIYFYVSKNLVQPYVRGFYNNILDHHPLGPIGIDRRQRTPNEFLRGRAASADVARSEEGAP